MASLLYTEHAVKKDESPVTRKVLPWITLEGDIRNNDKVYYAMINNHHLGDYPDRLDDDSTIIFFNTRSSASLEEAEELISAFETELSKYAGLTMTVYNSDGSVRKTVNSTVTKKVLPWITLEGASRNVDKVYFAIVGNHHLSEHINMPINSDTVNFFNYEDGCSPEEAEELISAFETELSKSVGVTMTVYNSDGTVRKTVNSTGIEKPLPWFTLEGDDRIVEEIYLDIVTTHPLGEHIIMLTNSNTVKFFNDEDGCSPEEAEELISAFETELSKSVGVTMTVYNSDGTVRKTVNSTGTKKVLPWITLEGDDRNVEKVYFAVVDTHPLGEHPNMPDLKTVNFFNYEEGCSPEEAEELISAFETELSKSVGVTMTVYNSDGSVRKTVKS